MMEGVNEEASSADLAARAMRVAHARSLLARVLAGRATLRSVAAALGMPLNRLPERREERRLAVYRAYLGAAVRTVSPLAIRVCELNGRSLDELALSLRPGMAWDRLLCGVRPCDAWLSSVHGGRSVFPESEAMREEWALQGWLHGGWPVYDSDDRTLIFGIRVLDAGLEMAALPGNHRLRTHGGGGSITLRRELPDSVMASLPGMPLDGILDHPLFEGVGCVVTAVDEPERWGTRVRFALDPTPWRMPWARLGD